MSSWDLTCWERAAGRRIRVGVGVGEDVILGMVSRCCDAIFGPERIGSG